MPRNSLLHLSCTRSNAHRSQGAVRHRSSSTQPAPARLVPSWARFPPRWRYRRSAGAAPTALSLPLAQCRRMHCASAALHSGRSPKHRPGTTPPAAARRQARGAIEQCARPPSPASKGVARLGLPFRALFFDSSSHRSDARSCLFRHELGELINLVFLKLGLSQDRHRVVNRAAPRFAQTRPLPISGRGAET